MNHKIQLSYSLFRRYFITNCTTFWWICLRIHEYPIVALQTSHFFKMSKSVTLKPAWVCTNAFSFSGERWGFSDTGYFLGNKPLPLKGSRVDAFPFLFLSKILTSLERSMCFKKSTVKEVLFKRLWHLDLLFAAKKRHFSKPFGDRQLCVAMATSQYFKIPTECFLFKCAIKKRMISVVSQPLCQQTLFLTRISGWVFQPPWPSISRHPVTQKANY